MTPAEHFRRDLEIKLLRRQKQHTTNTKLMENGVTKYDRDSARAAVNRNTKSISLLISKMLCQHDIDERRYSHFAKMYCRRCRHSATIKT